MDMILRDALADAQALYPRSTSASRRSRPHRLSTPLLHRLYAQLSPLARGLRPALLLDALAEPDPRFAPRMAATASHLAAALAERKPAPFPPMRALRLMTMHAKCDAGADADTVAVAAGDDLNGPTFPVSAVNVIAEGKGTSAHAVGDIMDAPEADGDIFLVHDAHLAAALAARPSPCVVDVRPGSNPCWADTALQARADALFAAVYCRLSAAGLGANRAVEETPEAMADLPPLRITLPLGACAVAVVGWLLHYPAVYWVGGESGNALGGHALALYRATTCDGTEVSAFSVPRDLSADPSWVATLAQWRSLAQREAGSEPLALATSYPPSRDAVGL